MAYDFPTDTAGIGQFYPSSVSGSEPQWIYLGSNQWKKVFAGGQPPAVSYIMSPLVNIFMQATDGFNPMLTYIFVKV